MVGMLVLYVGVGVLFVALAVPLTRRQVRPNPLYGLRTRRTLADPRLWYDANAYAGRLLARAGVAVALGAIILYAVPGLGLLAYTLAETAVLVVAVGAAMVLSLRYVASR